MKTIVILPSRDGKRLYRRLSSLWSTYPDTLLISEELDVGQGGVPPDRLLIYAQNVREIRGEPPIVVAAEDCEAIPDLPKTAVLIAPSSLFERLSPSTVQVIGCGPGPKESVTFSSLGPDRAVVSFQRSIQLSGGYHSIVPCEVPFELLNAASPTELLLTAAVLAVTGDLETGSSQAPSD